MARAVQAIMAQAPTWIAAYKADLASRGLGFTADDLAAVTASATANPLPPGYTPGAAPSAEDTATVERVKAQVAETVFPETGFVENDPRLVGHGMSLTAFAVAAKAVGWANQDDALIERVVTALGHTRADYDAASAWFTPMLSSDMAVATLYGQLFANVGDLPARP